ncbi:MAG: aminotransferase class III-fold pyridoxal phosphate-dependent enzyme, partial [Planctomycetia bacterium]
MVVAQGTPEAVARGVWERVEAKDLPPQDFGISHTGQALSETLETSPVEERKIFRQEDALQAMSTKFNLDDLGADARMPWDVDGRKFIDLMCSWGPNLLGYRHPAIEQAVQQQQALGDCFNGPTPRFVELAERFVERSAHADWVMFQKNGTDATTACLTIARAATGKRKILIAKNAYHGADPWCTPRPAGVTAEDRAHLIYY